MKHIDATSSAKMVNTLGTEKRIPIIPHIKNEVAATSTLDQALIAKPQ